MGASTPERGMPLHTRIFIGMFVGVALGVLARLTLPADSQALAWVVQNIALPVGQIFLRMIFMVVVPLVVAAIAIGVADIGDIRRMRRIGGKTLIYTVAFTTIAVLVGVTAVNVFQPGAGLTEEARQALMASLGAGDAHAKVVENAKHAKGFGEAILEFIPKNPVFEANRALEGGLMSLMFFAVMMGVAMLGIGEQKAAPLKAFLESVYEVMLKIIGYAMQLAPFGVAGLMFSVSVTMGAEAFIMLGKYVLVVLGALLFQQSVIYMGTVKLMTGRNPWQFLMLQQEALLTAFSTSSSVATLPTAMRVATDKLKLPKRVSDFVLTVGSTLNHHGTALFEGITILFLAQLFGVHLTLAQQVPIIFMAILGGFGTAGVPGGSLPMIVVVLNTIGVPGEAIAIILGIDRVLDMSRTTLNVAGDLTIATLVAHNEPHEEEALEAVVPGEKQETAA